MQKRRTTILALMLVCALIFSTASVSAKSLTEIKDQIKQEQDKLEQGKSQEQDLAKQIQDLEVKISNAESQLDTLRGKIETTEGKVATAQEDLKQAQEDVESQSENLNVRVRTMYKNGSIGFLDVLLGSGSISEFISNVDMVQKVYTSDKGVLSDLKNEYKVVNEKKAELESLQAQLESQKEQQQEKQAELTASKTEVSKKKTNVAASNEALQDNIQDLNAEADRIAAIIERDRIKSQESNNTAKGDNDSNGSNSASSEKSSSDSGKSSNGEKSSKDDDSDDSSSSSSQFSWPVPGYSRVSSNYGWRTCPFHGREKHTGIDIPASYGVSVKAAASGTVIFSGYLGSYGNAIIIRHEDGLYTLYGHNSSLVASEGTKVSKGQTVAKIGSTGSSTGNHCHFEVRKGGSGYGNDVNPWNYL